MRSDLSIARLLIAAVAIVSLGIAGPAKAAPETITFKSGDKVLHGLVYKPAGPGPFPTVLYNHGSAPGLINNKAFDILGPIFVANQWAFFAPYRRGQGLSSDAGPYIRDEIQAAQARGGVSLGVKAMVRLLQTEQLQDQMAGLAWLQEQPFVRGDGIAVMGNSFGGIETVLGSKQGSYCAAVDISGGAESWEAAPSLRRLMVDAVRHSKAPILFLQAENDYTTEPSRTLYAAMQAGNKPSEIRLYPAYGDSPEEGHSFAYRGVDLWFTDVMRFLRKNCEENDVRKLSHTSSLREKAMNLTRCGSDK